MLRKIFLGKFLNIDTFSTKRWHDSSAISWRKCSEIKLKYWLLGEKNIKNRKIRDLVTWYSEHDSFLTKVIFPETMIIISYKTDLYVFRQLFLVHISEQLVYYLLKLRRRLFHSHSYTNDHHWNKNLKYP